MFSTKKAFGSLLLAITFSVGSIGVAQADASTTAPPPVIQQQQVSPNDLWSHVVGVYLSKISCEAARISVGWRYPKAYCTSNPDNNGTWLLIDKPFGGSWSVPVTAS